MSGFSHKQEDVTIEVEVHKETPLAFLVSDDGFRTMGFGRSGFPSPR